MVNRPRVKTLAGFILLALTILATGCGGSDQPTAAKSPASVPSPSGPSSAKPGGGEGDFCAAVKAQTDGFPAAFPKDFTNAAQLKVYGQFLKTTNAALTRTAPAEIADAARLQARVSNAAADFYINGNQPPPAVRAQVAAPEYLAAATKVTDYAKKHCGFSGLPSPSS